jgi:hypothetical protein
MEGRLAGFLSQQLKEHTFKRFMLVIKLKTKSYTITKEKEMQPS